MQRRVSIEVTDVSKAFQIAGPRAPLHRRLRGAAARQTRNLEVLKNVSFEFSNVSRVQFAGARLDNVDFKGAYTYRTHFEGVDLSRVVNLGPIQLQLGCGDEKTRLPEGLSAPQEWPCTE